MPEPARLAGFYEDAYRQSDPDLAATYSRWRSLGAAGKAAHVIELCARAGVKPASTLDVGCGDGALLSELRRRCFGGRLAGVEISAAAVALAAQRPGIGPVQRYDGRRLPAPDGAYDLGILSHVLEHVGDPAALLREVGRACRAVLVEVPLEKNLSAARASKRAGAAEIGHLQRLDRHSARELVAAAGLTRCCELTDPLPARVHLFFADTAPARAAALAKWTLRRTLHALARPLALRLFTVHYACLCVAGPASLRAMAGAQRPGAG
jgi:SAM-dependent methyltransferase